METLRVNTYQTSLDEKMKKNKLHRNVVLGLGQGMGAFFQMWGYALMFYFGSWLMLNRDYTMRDYLVSLFALMLSLTGLSAAMMGLTDADKAKEAAVRIFDLIDRVSEIDPLSDNGKKQN